MESTYHLDAPLAMMHKQGFHACILIVLVFLIYKLQKNIKRPNLIELEK